MFHAKIMDCTQLQWLFSAKGQKRFGMECILASLWTNISDHSTLVNKVMENDHSAMHSGYDSCLESILERFPGHTCDFGPVYHSRVKRQVNAHQSTLNWNVLSNFASLNHGLESLRYNDIAAD